MKEYFGYDHFRPSQWKLIENVLNGRDQLGVMATGYGKSLCFQFPSVYKQTKLTVVISPLLSLMEDQVSKLESMGIAAAMLGSSAKKPATTFKRVLAGEIRLLYITPEYAHNQNHKLLEISQAVEICCWAIDEAHCVSQAWFPNSNNSLTKLKKKRNIHFKIKVGSKHPYRGKQGQIDDNVIRFELHHFRQNRKLSVLSL